MATDTIAYVAVSLDGYIAGDGGTVDFLEAYGSEEYDFHGFMAQVGGLVMGATTYEQIIGWGWPYGNLPGLVLTNRDLDVPEGVDIEFTSGDVGEAIRSYADRTDGRLWIVGGGRVIVDAMNEGVVDVLEIYVMPVALGSGVPLFPSALTAALTLSDASAFSNGAAMLRYDVSV